MTKYLQMVFHDWRDAARILRQRLAEADADQLRLASLADIQIAQGTPALVAAALLRTAFAGPLREGPERPVSPGQQEFLSDLISDLGVPRPTAANYEIMSAWLEVLRSSRALLSLEREKPRRGDLVTDIAKPQLAPAMVSSLNQTGLVYLLGPSMPRIPAHRLRVVAHKDDESELATSQRTAALNVRAHYLLGRIPQASQLKVLEPFRSKESPTIDTIEVLERTLEKAEDERPLQKLLEKYPELLAGLTTSSWGTFVRPQVSLAGQKIPDFLLAIANSGGVHWTLIELESPRAVKVGTQEGKLGESARKGIQQIEDWKEWLIENLAYAHDNAGLLGIRPESPGMVIVGRRGVGPWPSEAARQRLKQDRDILLHSWDWLIEALEHGAGVDRPHGPLTWPDWYYRD